MKKLNCDILIIGGGLIGLITAYSLALLGFKIIVAEKKQTKGRYRVNKKNFFDIRTTAISEGSKEFLDKINLWGTISAFAEPIKFIDVIDRKETRKINFYNNNKNQNLGYIIENNLFSQSIVSKVNNNKKINYYDNTNLNHITYNNETITGVFDNFSIITKLIIAADGKNSTVRNISNIKTFSKKYNEKAIVMNIAHELDHRNHAYEFFFESGPLAILPMKEKPLNNFRSSLVWSHNKRFIDSLSTSSEGKIISVLEEQLQSIIGKVKKIYGKQTFPLSSHLNSKFYSERIIFIGDAAHSIHPIAGQGWNLGIRDVKNLYNLSEEQKGLGLEVGALNYCKTYHDKCYYDSYRMYNITDKLNSLFISDSKIIKLLRGIGFEIIEKNNFLKKSISNFAMGLN